jgi:phenylpyruvate tautomerase PptA (4-oxalocrotonate tautomerase family)
VAPHLPVIKTEEESAMPLVRISLQAGKSAATKRKIADAIHAALVETLNAPADDRFQIVTEHAAEDLIVDPTFLGIARSADVVIVQVALRKGRTVEQKQAFYRRIAERLHDAVGLRLEDTVITLVENDLPDWSFGNGVAQYVK